MKWFERIIKAQAETEVPEIPEKEPLKRPIRMSPREKKSLWRVAPERGKIKPQKGRKNAR